MARSRIASYGELSLQLAAGVSVWEGREQN